MTWKATFASVNEVLMSVVWWVLTLGSIAVVFTIGMGIFISIIVFMCRYVGAKP